MKIWCKYGDLSLQKQSFFITCVDLFAILNKCAVEIQMYFINTEQV